jgi:hypothetical protein
VKCRARFGLTKYRKSKTFNGGAFKLSAQLISEELFRCIQILAVSPPSGSSLPAEFKMNARSVPPLLQPLIIRTITHRLLRVSGDTARVVKNDRLQVLPFPTSL